MNGPRPDGQQLGAVQQPVDRQAFEITVGVEFDDGVDEEQRIADDHQARRARVCGDAWNRSTKRYSTETVGDTYSVSQSIAESLNLLPKGER